MNTINTILQSLSQAIEKLWDKDSLMIFFILAIIGVEIFAIFVKKTIKKRIFATQKDLGEENENPEYYLEYYKK